MQQKEKFIQIDRLTDEELEDSKRLFDQFIESGLSLEQFKRKVPGSLRKLRKSFIIQKERNPFEYLDALLIQRRIVNDHLNDMVKYTPGSDRIKARECFQSIPLQLAKENKKFQYKLVKKVIIPVTMNPV